MRAEKKVIGKLDKCYSIAPLVLDGKEHLLVAAEKIDRCLLFDMDGNLKDTVWTEPGGAMTMVQVPEAGGQFLSTHKFYSPNDSKEAKIVIVTPVKPGEWEVRTLAKLPHVHRFDILERNNTRYIIACTLKSGHEYKDDWSSPGKVYGAVLPRDLSGYNEERQLEFKVIKDNMLKNHGYYRVEHNGSPACVVSAESGVFLFVPPEHPEGDWEITQLLDTPASDAVLIDLDEDGEMELAVISPFHGERISIYKKAGVVFQKVYDYEKPAQFSHAIFGGRICGRPSLVIGHRKGERNLLVFTWNREKGEYQAQILDRDCGSANVYLYAAAGEDRLISANRETDEIAMYTFLPDEA